MWQNIIGSKIRRLQQEIFEQTFRDCENEWYPDSSPRLLATPVGEDFEMVYFGNGYDDDPSKKAELGEEYANPFPYVLDFLTQQEIANRIISLTFIGPDEGANGISNWDFTRLVDSDAVFSRLKRFHVKLTDPGDHNMSIVAADGYHENGLLAKLLHRMPVLTDLAVPSAPDRTFFETGLHLLQDLTIQAGLDHQDFIRNLSQCDNFGQLRFLDYTEYEKFLKHATSFEDYCELFRSSTLPSLKVVRLRNDYLTASQMAELKRMRENVLLMHIHAKSGQYATQ